MSETESQQSYYNQQAPDYTALKVRLDTEPLITTIKMFLSGKAERLIKVGEQYEIMKDKIGEPLANDEGQAHILQLIYMVINKDVVQGNLDADEINQIVADSKRDLARELMIHSVEWEIKKDRRTHIVRTIEKTIKGFLSRTKDNKERESYIPMMKVTESNTVRENDNKKGLNFFSK